MLTTIGFIALVIGIILVVLGYTAAPTALRPGWGLTILGLILVLVGYLIPEFHHDDYDALRAFITL